MSLHIKLIHNDAKLPKRAHPCDAGLDIYAVESCILYSGVHAVLPTGFQMAIPPGFVGIIKPRSGLAVKHSIDVLAGVIDSEYRGEVKVTLLNHSERQMEIKKGDRIAQLLIVPVSLETPIEVEDLDCTARGSGGFGSTGL